MIQDEEGTIVEPSAFGACMFCHATASSSIATFNQPPKGEVPLTAEKNYQRYLVACDVCGHIRNHHTMNLDGEYYRRQYWEQSYNAKAQHTAEVEEQFFKILALEPSKSDNAYRCQRVCNFFHEYTKHYGTLPKNLLDIGSGLSVFGYGMKKQGFHVTALDPNPMAIVHARKQSAADATIEGLFPSDEVMSAIEDKKFSLVTMNKVLEHVKNPIPMLACTKNLLVKGGIVYIELPDATSALHSEKGVNRSEFCVQHYHAFSFRSTLLMVEEAGFEVQRIARICEPSGKFTIYCFARASHESKSA